MIGTKPIHQPWGDFTLDLAIKSNCLNINIKDNTSAKSYEAIYSFDNLPDKIKNTYQTVEGFYQELAFVIQSKDSNRFKIKQDGEIIFIMHKTKSGKLLIVQQTLITDQKTPEINDQDLHKFIRNFDVQKYKNQKKIVKIQNEIAQIQTSTKHQTDFIKSLVERIQVLQKSQIYQKQKVLNQELLERLKNLQSLQKIQKQDKIIQNILQRILKLENSIINQGQVKIMENLIERIKKLQTSDKQETKATEIQNINSWIKNIQNQLSNFVQKKNKIKIKNDGRNRTTKNRSFLRLNNKKKLSQTDFTLQIKLIKQENAERFKIILDQEAISRIPFIKTAEKLFKYIILIIKDNKTEERIKISEQGFFSIKFIYEMEGKKQILEEVFKPELIQFNEIERLQNLIQIKNKNIQKHQQQNYKQLKKFIQSQIQNHRTKEHSSLDSSLTKLKEQIQELKASSIHEFKENQKLELQSSQEKNLNLQNQILNMKQKLLSPQFIIPKLKISNIIQNAYECEKLFQLFPKKIKFLKQLFKASQHNFQISKFHQKCDGISHTVTLITTQYGQIIGGYTKCKWQSTDNGTSVGDDDFSSFIFSLSNNLKLTNKNKNQSILNHKSYGPTFGSSFFNAGNIFLYLDLGIGDSSNRNSSNWADIGQNYINNKNYFLGQQQQSSKQFIGGDGSSNYFRTIEWEVYQVIFTQ